MQSQIDTILCRNKYIRLNDDRKNTFKVRNIRLVCMLMSNVNGIVLAAEVAIGKNPIDSVKVVTYMGQLASLQKNNLISFVDDEGYKRTCLFIFGTGYELLKLSLKQLIHSLNKYSLAGK